MIFNVPRKTVDVYSLLLLLLPGLRMKLKQSERE